MRTMVAVLGLCLLGGLGMALVVWWSAALVFQVCGAAVAVPAFFTGCLWLWAEIDTIAERWLARDH